ncbi:hypothetical protein LCGC14_0342800 [marine sediment metagenome]|uniref:Uncharacterized protein n=1 Tax=marine sediment metagenome TaxID=412755 RepID=A0A0F9TVV7_9ZZZZ
MLYNGDCNIEYGGSYIDLSSWEDEYCECVQVTDLDSGCGADGMVMIEHVVILLYKGRWKSALDCCGLTTSDLLSMDSDARKHCLADCLLSCGHFDPEICIPAEIIQAEDYPMECEGFTATKRISKGDLRGYIEAVHVTD